MHEFLLVTNVVELLHHVTSKWNISEKDDNANNMVAAAQLSGDLHIKYMHTCNPGNMTHHILSLELSDLFLLFFNKGKKITIINAFRIAKI